jgi:hypothetical protein
MELEDYLKLFLRSIKQYSTGASTKQIRLYCGYCKVESILLYCRLSLTLLLLSHHRRGRRRTTLPPHCCIFGTLDPADPNPGVRDSGAIRVRATAPGRIQEFKLQVRDTQYSELKLEA